MELMVLETFTEVLSGVIPREHPYMFRAERIAKLNIIFRIGFNLPLQDGHVVVYQNFVVFKLQCDLVLAGLNLLQA